MADGEEQVRVEIEVDALASVSFAAAQNDVPVLRGLRVVNQTDAPLESVTLTLSPQPGFLREKTWNADRIAPGETLSFSQLKTNLDIAFLDGLTEAERGSLRFRLDAGGEAVAEAEVPIEALARDQWGGVGDTPQLLAAFVSPNDPGVAALLRHASKLLEQGGHKSAMEGYQSRDPARAYMLAAAIWSAAAGLSLTYAEPPRSFEQAGQKVRSAGQVGEAKLATCLDTTLLLASAFEAAGLNPVAVFTQGHAFVGVWLKEKTLGGIVEPDVVELRKAVAHRELVLLETTLLCERPTVGFDPAAKAGAAQVAEAVEADFLLAVDIRRARDAGIRPLASREEAAPAADETVAEPPALPRPPASDDLPADVADLMPTTAQGRIGRWQQKLLDLSLRNRLLNFKETKQTVPLTCPDIGAVEDDLAADDAFRLISLRDENPAGDRGAEGGKSGAEIRREVETAFAERALAADQLCVPLPDKEMKARLTNLYRRAKSDLAEGGANTLFLAAGFLRWRKTATDQTVYKAPILLIPVRLERKAATSAFTLRGHDDDLAVNQTLLQMLKRDFELRVPVLEGELPTDHSGYDLPRIFDAVRRAVRDVPGFEVTEQSAIATFSFAKYLMWKDLVDRTDQLRENRLVRHLIDTPDRPFEADGRGLPEPASLDRAIAPKDLYTPLPADSSQLAAVVAAAEGRDMVVIGPPGTGKSQTIANMIAQCLASGKTVLFVAEKSAALAVVHRRLKQFGLGDACLELHSNKADRKSVIGQLGRAWDRSAASSADEWVRINDKLTVRRDQLNAYVAALHRPGSHGVSVFEAVGVTSGGEAPFTLSFDRVDAHDAASLADMRDLAEELHHVWRPAKLAEDLSFLRAARWSFGWQDAVLGAAHDLIRSADAAADAARPLAGEYGLSADDADQLRVLKRLADYVAYASAQDGDAEPFFGTAIAETREAVAALQSAVSRLAEARSAAAADYADEEAQRVDIDALDKEWREAGAKIWPFSALGRRRVRKLLQSYAEGGKADPDKDVPALRAIRAELAAVAASSLRDASLYDGERTDFERANRLLSVAEEATRRAAILIEGAADRATAEQAARRQIAAGADLADRHRIVDNVGELDERLTAFADLAGIDASFATVTEARQAAKAVIENADTLEAWTKWQAARQAAIGRGLAPLVDALERDAVTDARAAFDAAYFSWWLPRAFDQDPLLLGFSSAEHERRIVDFRALDEASRALASEQVRLRISGSLPPRESVPRRSELGVLRHQLGLQRPSMPVRGLIERMPDAFAKLAPCVLMSPLSVAQYLPAGQAPFDVVIFDEASQITTWDAVGAIARGKQSVIVGDPKQLPPTNFFGQTNDGDDGAALFEQDLPSILDEAYASGMPSALLNWHYRSRDESLIAFSNHHYYDDRLVTFPSPTVKSEAVSLHEIGGVYTRGAAINQEEAEALTAYAIGRLVRWLRLPEDSRPTLGVVTFNQKQQALIEDLLDKGRRAYPDIEWFFAEDRDEPVIVRNLENVQGDERDVMLFSITFGADKAGKISMNFGAINKDGGEKRLNVAVTRARRELHVFASISADQIDLNRTKARGVRDLKSFLDYAARGAVALPATEEGSLGPADSPFEEAVAEGLRSKGWEVRTQIGVSGFRIDLGIVDPDRAGAYLCGVECDGATYHRSATARDRDQVRESVLRGLGWEIVRIWSTDWFKNRNRVLDEVHAKLEELRDAKREAAQTEAEATDEPDGIEIDFSAEEPETPSILEGPVAEEEDDTDRQATSSEGLRQLHTVDTDHLDGNRFFEEAYTPVLSAFIETVVAKEGPMRERRLAQIVARAHGWQRSGRRIRERVTACLGASVRDTRDGAAFIWPEGAVPERVPFRENLGRTPREVPKAEIRWLLDEDPDLSKEDDPAVALARRMGIGRLSQDGRAYLDTVIFEKGVRSLFD